MGFRNIHEMVDAAAAYDHGKHDHVVHPEFAGRTVQVDPDLLPARMESRATSGLCNFLSDKYPYRIPAGFLNAVPDSTYQVIMNDHLRPLTHAQWLFRCHEDHVRAVVSRQYPRFGVGESYENTTILDTLRPIFDAQSGGYEMFRWHVDRDTMHLTVVFKEFATEDGPYGAGVTVSNDEVGGAKFRIHPSIKRGACWNSLVLGEGFEIAHRGGAHKFLVAISDVVATLPVVLDTAMDSIKKFIESRAIVIPDMTKAITDMAKDYGWTEQEKLQVMRGTEGQDTLAGLVNGLTSTAHIIHDNAPTKRFEMEKLAGKVFAQGLKKAEREAPRRMFTGAAV